VQRGGIAIERILLLSMGFGTGHNAAAKALECQFAKQRPHLSVEVVDLLKLIPGSFHPLLQSGYQGMLNKFPTLYHYLYDWTHHNKIIRYVSSEMIEKMGWTIRKKLSQLFPDEPARIVTTHPFGTLLCPADWENVLTVGVVTDYELHPIWLARVPDVLCVPKQLLRRGDLERIQWKTGLKLLETGIPINPAFYEEVSALEARLQLGLDPNRPVVLIMGGGTGLGPLEQIVEELKGFTWIQFVVLTGKNHNLYQRLKKKHDCPHILIEAFRRDVALFMSAADLLVTKPGGLTISEAIAKRLPMFLFEAFPGQEEANQQYLLHHRVAMITRPSTIRIQIEKFFSPGFNRQRIRERFTPLLSPGASRRIVRETLTAKEPVVQTL
jgi:processive 1,2-diacylglycerol beta-glucosyltransferase